MRNSTVCGLLLATLVACDPLRNPPCQGGEGLLYPLEPGAWWRHDVVEPSDNHDSDHLCKLVRIGAKQQIPWRRDVDAYPALSLDYTRPVKDTADTGNKEVKGAFDFQRRWQDIVDCSVRRQVDETFEGTDTDSPLKEVKFYCPYHDRVRDCPGACDGQIPDVDECKYVSEGASWEERYFELTVTVSDETSTKTHWEECLSIDIDPDTCAVLSKTPKGCVYDREESLSAWRVVAVNASLHVPAGTFDVIKQTHDAWDPSMDEWEGSHVFSWSRGVGKVKEYEFKVVNEKLVRYCLPSEGCTDDAPSVEDLTIECDG
jgi:hypothetical protein